MDMLAEKVYKTTRRKQTTAKEDMKQTRKERAEEVLAILRSLFNLGRLFVQRPKDDNDIVSLTDAGNKAVSRATAILLNDEDGKSDEYVLGMCPTEYRKLLQALEELPRD